MTGTKKFYKSKGVMGGLMALLGAGVNLGGLALTGEDISALIGHIDTLLVAIGGLLAMWGRFKAKTRIG